MKDKFFSIVLHPFFIAFIISLAIIYFLPDYFPKYTIELKEQSDFSRKGSKIYFQDLNNDNISEKISSYKNIIGEAGFEIHKANGDLIDQWNFSTYFPTSRNSLSFLDIDDNGFKEIYAITQHLDSVFLNIVEPLAPKGKAIMKKKVFIDTLTSHNNKYHLNIFKIKVTPKNLRKNKEVFFDLNVGFGGNPRNVYKYNLDNNQVSKSPHLTNSSHISHLFDIDGNGYNEILISNYSAGNAIDSIYTSRSDYSLWLNILDHDLNFLFDPIEFNVPFSSLRTFPFKNKSTFNILCLMNTRQTDVSPSKLYIFSIQGKLLKEKELPYGSYRLLSNYKKDEFVLYDWNTGLIQNFNSELEVLTSFYIESTNSNLQAIDIDKDNKLEWLATSNDVITIYRENFKHPVRIELPDSDDITFHIGLKELNKTQNHLYFQYGDTCYIYNYSKNPLYTLEYVIYLGIFLVIAGFVYLIMNLQKIRMQKQRVIEKEIAELQIKAIKNQVDPHFVFNAINTISEMTLTDNKLEADDFICRFSDFMRGTLQSSDKISTSLKEELEYSENFIKLQKIRHQNSFDYQINVVSDIDLKTSVPKHVLFTYIENAIKHGLSHKKKGGLLKITVRREQDNLLLAVEDNGSGLATFKSSKKDSTGNGLKIMENIYKLYTKLYKKKIKHKLVGLFDDQKNKSGLRVEIYISNK